LHHLESFEQTTTITKSDPIPIIELDDD